MAGDEQSKHLVRDAGLALSTESFPRYWQSAASIRARTSDADHEQLQAVVRAGGSALVNASEVARTSQHLPTNLHRSRARPGAEASKVFSR